MAEKDPTYADKLRKALDRDGWSQARLVKALASKTGNAPESERSAVRGYLRNATPRPERARLIAEITGVHELASVEHPRQSGAARLEDRLEALAVAVGDLLENQAAGMALLEEIRDVLAPRAAGARTAPKRSRR